MQNTATMIAEAELAYQSRQRPLRALNVVANFMATLPDNVTTALDQCVAGEIKVSDLANRIAATSPKDAQTTVAPRLGRRTTPGSHERFD